MNQPASDPPCNSHSWTSIARRPLVRGLFLPAAANRSIGWRQRLGVIALAAFTLPVLAAPQAMAAAGQPPLPRRHVTARIDSLPSAQTDRAAKRAGANVGRDLPLPDAVAAGPAGTGLAPSGTLPAPSGTVPAPSETVPAPAALPGAAVVASAPLPADPADAYSPKEDANSLYNIEQVVGARTQWTNGFTGSGVDVALVDSGVAQVAGLNPNNIIYGPDLTPEAQNPATANTDTYGHGTHLAGIIAGHDAAVTDVTTAANDSQNFLGVAPDARIVSVKVADQHGNTDVSQVIAGIDWVVQHAHVNGLNIRVLNVSFGSDASQAYTSDPLAYAAEQAWKHGIVVVVSAGNSGASSGRVTDPAIDPYVLAVGADDTQGTTATTDDTIPSFSSTGDGIRNPDLVAPGVHVQSLRASGSHVALTYAATGALGKRYFRGSGTSQSAAVVSGAAALLLQRNPALTPDQVKYLLTSSAQQLPAAPAQAQGAGLLSLPTSTDAVPAAIQTFPSSLGGGSLEASRGSTHVSVRDPATGKEVLLVGEQDVHGALVLTGELAALERTATSWRAGRTGERGTASIDPSSSAWASSSWASSAWASSSWASSAWASSSWASSSWASSSWASSCWASSSWASSSWASAKWS